MHSGAQCKKDRLWGLIGSCQHRCKLDDAIIYIFDLSWQINNSVKGDKKTHVYSMHVHTYIQNDSIRFRDLIENITADVWEIITYVGKTWTNMEMAINRKIRNMIQYLNTPDINFIEFLGIFYSDIYVHLKFSSWTF